MMSSNDLLLKSSFNEWMRLSTQFTGVIAELEKEILRMKEKRLSAELIDQKDSIVETLVSFFNTTDQLITAYRIAVINKQAEICIVNDMLSRLSGSLTERVITRYVADLRKLPDDIAMERRKQRSELVHAVSLNPQING